ncbi:MAG: hypothetical protein BWY95_01195 [Bacteroidetes bacterium ADurb.BinA104]|nr:MAG: hypothetical protein BWY95_01195 [Bacteroidetes bacterium ADurb.BinA104]
MKLLIRAWVAVVALTLSRGLWVILYDTLWNGGFITSDRDLWERIHIISMLVLTFLWAALVVVTVMYAGYSIF